MKSLRHYSRAVQLLAFPLLSITLFPTALHAMISATDEECRKLYGEPTSECRHSDLKLGSRLTRIYSWNGFDVAAQFVGESVSELQCVSICYRAQQPRQITKQEIDKILALNGRGGNWKGTTEVWAYRKWIAQKNSAGDTLSIRRVAGDGDASFPTPIASLPPRAQRE